MYVITFYSFKGGVGRTMALVNVAAELARRGRKVLVVDFDLEAPGLETYKHLRPPKPLPGIVEYVTEFRRTQQVPNLLDHLYEAKPIGKKGGRLWVMPAGRRDRAYRAALANLDWTRLYQHEGGFLLFEDMKKGWEEELKPDYVLIDSRTGDTDVLGICTRQLPDSVVLMFTPNEQNLAGLEHVCRDIRREETEGLKKAIRLHFVAANVPDLDDEKRILHRQLQAFRQRLGFKELSGVIRRYDDPGLLDQSIFTLDRPHSRLARSYRHLLRALLKDNLTDRDGAMAFLQDYPQWMETRRAGNAISVTHHRLGEDAETVGASQDLHCLHTIVRNFNEDVEILNGVAGCLMKEEAYKSARNVLDLVLRLEPNRAYSVYERAICKIILGEIDDAAEDLLECLRVLSLPQGRPPTDQPRGFKFSGVGQSIYDRGFKQECLARLCVMAPAKLAKLVEMIESQQIQGVELRSLTGALCRREEGIPIAARLLRNSIADLDKGEMIDGFALLQARCWKEVLQLGEAGRVGKPGAHSLLDFALAHWGENGEMPESVCRQALEQAGESEFANLDRSSRFQAIALLCWGAGEVGDAIACLQQAEQSAYAETEDVFSWWWLRDVSAGQFLDDFRLLRRMFQGEPLRPAFLGPPSPTPA